MLEVLATDGPSPKVDIDDETYTLSSLRIKDFGDFRDWVKEKRLTIFMNAAEKVGMDMDKFTSNIQKILGVTPEIDDSDPDNTQVDDDVLQQMGTEEGMEHLVYLSIKRNHPEVEKDDLNITFQDLEKLTSLIGEISGLPQTDEENVNVNPPVAEDKES